MRSSRSGFTLGELLVAMAIIVVLAGLLLPAIQNAREGARAAQCQNNLRQIGIALHLYHTAHNMFPPGCVGIPGDPVNIQGWGWATLSLPYLEEVPLYELLEPNRNTLSAVLGRADLQPFLRTPLAVFRCASDAGDALQSEDRTLSGFELGLTASAAGRTGGPFAGPPLLAACIMGGPPVVLPPLLDPTNPDPGTSDPPAAPSAPTNSALYGVRAATSNYVASFGDYWLPAGAVWTTNDFAGNGVFGSNVSVRMRDISDGASRTFAVGERSWDDFASIWAGTDGWNRCEREGVAMVLATAYYPLNSPPEAYHMSCDPKGAAGFSSMHPHGAYFLIADGAVRFVGNEISFANSDAPSQLGIFQRLARRDDGQAVDAF